ncbi:helix-turn-helix domain-containing protein [Bradyrhizobium sp. BWC-3-1]|uniref:helix-turn-helix domain-containing protein n=1 Tax=Bradyrhizobium sp. BWC-3-1 TaxID=3080012 RepID=UPI00293F3EFB|nr:helix-turn-helix domain-containing protein [Bradyrhizobium sp. BWC-3-1]WOH61797.1 helix-turn-helix domain-containing protein [Bradyrhizobium sp. BWC-3-1]
MSLRAYEWAWKQSVSPTKKLVLLELCDHHNEQRGDNDVWPKQDTIAERTGFTSRAVNSALKALESEGLIERRPRYLNRKRTSDVITILIDRNEVVSAATQTPNPGPSSPAVPEEGSGSNQKEIPDATGTTFTVIGKDQPARLNQPVVFFPEYWEPHRPDLDAWNYAARTIVEISVQLGTAIDWDSPGIQNLWPVVEWLKRLGDQMVTSSLIKVGARAVKSNTKIRSWKYFEAEISQAGA